MTVETHSARRALETAFQAATRYVEGIDHRRVAPDRRALESMQDLLKTLPQQPMDPADVVEMLDRLGSPATVASTGARFFGLVVGATLPAALGARMLASAWDQVVFNDATSPVGCALERHAASWLLDVLALPSDAYVSFVTGATMGSFTCLAAARERLLQKAGYSVAKAGLRNAPQLRIIVSDEIHVTVVKALMLLGWGSDDIHRVPTDDQGRMRADLMPPLDERTIICLQAGNVNSGAFDPFLKVCDAAREAGAWVHVDGAFGLWAASSAHYSCLTAGVAQADSWVVDGHKWLNTPYDCGMAIVKDPLALHAVMATQAPYLREVTTVAPKDMAPEFSRSARGVEVWAALLSLGREGLADLIDRCCANAQLLAAELRREGFEILNDVVLNQVVAQIGTPAEHAAIVENAQAGGECWFGLTTWKGKNALRFSIASWKTEAADIHRTVRAISNATANLRRG